MSSLCVSCNIVDTCNEVMWTLCVKRIYECLGFVIHLCMYGTFLILKHNVQLSKSVKLFIAFYGNEFEVTQDDRFDDSNATRITSDQLTNKRM